MLTDYLLIALVLIAWCRVYIAYRRLATQRKQHMIELEAERRKRQKLAEQAQWQSYSVPRRYDYPEE